MTKVVHTFGRLLPVGLLLALLFACEDDSNPVGQEQRARNDEDIRAYLTANGINAQRTDDGLYYAIVSRGTSNQKPKAGDEIKITYVARRLDGVLVDSSQLSTGTPIRAIYSVSKFKYNDGRDIFSDPALAEIFGSLLSEGDSALLLLPSHLGVPGTGTLLFPAYTPVRIDLKVVAVSTEEEQMENFELEHDNVVVTERTNSGLRFGKLTARPDSAQVKDGDKLKVRYTGRLMDYTPFDSGTLTATAGTGTSVVPGFSEGLLKMRIGEKAHLLFPSSLGYGTQGKTNSRREFVVPPFAPLFFEVEILSKEP